jgi:hypothetical protein
MMTFVRRGRTTSALGAVVAVVTIFLLAGCGSSSSSSSSSSAAASSSAPASSSASGTTSSAAASGGSSAAVAAAKAQYAQYVKVQAPIQIPVLPKKPPTGLTITTVTCPLPVCATETNAADAAAKQLGWKVTSLSTPLTPAGYQTTVNQVVTHPSQLLALTPLVPNSFVSKQLAALQAKKIPITEMSTAGNDEPSPAGPVIAAVAGSPQLGFSGQLMADTIVNDAGAGAKTVFVTDPSISVWKSTQAAFTKVITATGGSVDVLNINSQNVGKQVPSQVVSYMQAHPDVKYIGFALSDLNAGVPEALAAAGIKGVKIISRAPEALNLANIKAGTEWASVGEENNTGGYRAIDQLARTVEKVPLGDLRNPVGWHQIYIQSNVTQTSAPPTTPGSPAVFIKAWHLQ